MKYVLEDTCKTDDLNFVEISIWGSSASSQILNCKREFALQAPYIQCSCLTHLTIKPTYDLVD